MADSESRNASNKKKDSKSCRQKKHSVLSSNFKGYAGTPPKKGLETRSHSKTLWSYYFEGNVKIPEICTDSLTMQCPKEKKGCNRLHAKQPWHWQLLHKNEWYNFIHTQSDVLESAFRKVDAEEVVIPSLNPSKTGKIGQSLLQLLGTDCWKADFSTMNIKRVEFSDTIQIRRLSTPSSTKFKNKFSTDYIWFIQQDHTWVDFDQFFENKDKSFQKCMPSRSQTVSSEIESKYQKDKRASITLSLLNDELVISFSNMECWSKCSNEAVPVRRRPENCNVTYPNVWSHLIQDADIAEICTDIACKTCLNSSKCGRVHVNYTWHWQVFHNDIWYSLPKVQANALERTYIDMWHDSVQIPALNLAKMGDTGTIMSSVLGTSKWLATYDNKTLTKLNRREITLKIRRLSPPPTDTLDPKIPSKFVWFYKNEENVWLEFGCVDMKDDTVLMCSQTASNDIEEVFLSNKQDEMDVTVMGSPCKLTFSSMTLYSNKTQDLMAVRRRPQCARSNSIYARALGIIPLSEDSKEYDETKASLLLSMKEPEMANIKRFQNPELRRVFWKRQKEVSVLYGSGKNVNILTLFHWVKKGNVENIHLKNFGRRHQCPEIDKTAGKGVCFFKSAEFLHKSCSPAPSTKNHILLLFEIIIRKRQKTDEDTSGKSSDTVVDDSNMPDKFFVSDKRDYCPAYMIEF